eukprot:6462260-Amphidinium_carterae.1
MNGSSLTVEPKAELLDDICALLSKISSQNLVSQRSLRKLVGKLSHVGTLVPSIRPFVQPLWAALFAKGCSNAPPGFLWVRQIQHAVQWLVVFFVDWR